jgi:polyisoprenoid-binding protein YceI
VQEELASIGAATAVGRTPDVSGTITIDGMTVTTVEISADLTTLRSDNDRRDNQLRTQGLETDTYPTATFVLTEPIELPAEAASGETVTVDATGELTIHGVTNEVTIAIEARLDGDIIVVVGSIFFTET